MATRTPTAIQTYSDRDFDPGDYVLASAADIILDNQQWVLESPTIIAAGCFSQEHYTASTSYVELARIFVSHDLCGTSTGADVEVSFMYTTSPASVGKNAYLKAEFQNVSGGPNSYELTIDATSPASDTWSAFGADVSMRADGEEEIRIYGKVDANVDSLTVYLQGILIRSI